MRLIVAISAVLGLHLWQGDANEAFLNSDTTEVTEGVRIFVKPPEDCGCPQGCVWELFKMLYGLKSAPLAWFLTISKVLNKLGYKQCRDDPCLFIKIKESIYSVLALVVDDILAASNTKQANAELLHGLRQHFSIKDLGEPKYCLGINIRRLGRNHIRLSQEAYITKLLQQFKQEDAKPVYTPAVKDHVLTRDMCGSKTGVINKPYRNLVGALLYATITRPDIQVSVSILAQFSEDPGIAHWNAAIRVLRYLKATLDLCLDFKPTKCPKGQELIAYVDASFDSCIITSRSRTGYFLSFCGCIITWRSSLQPIVALSTCEAEYVAMSRAAQDVVCMRRVLRDLGFAQSATQMFGDNSAALKLADNDMVRPRTRHIRRRYHYIREQVTAGLIVAVKIAGTENPADFLTKVLGKRLFDKQREHYVR